MAPNGSETEPTEFDSKSFLQSIDDLKKKLEPGVACKEHLPLQELIQVMVAGNTTIASFKLFSVYSQLQLEDLRDNLDAVVRCIDKLSNRLGHVKTVEGGAISFEGLSQKEKRKELDKLKKAIEDLSDSSVDAELAALSAAFTARKVEHQRIEAERAVKEEESRREEEEAAKTAKEDEDTKGEEERKRQEEEERKAKEEEEQKAKEEEERKAKEEEERKAKEEEERKAKEEEERKAKDEEERKAKEREDAKSGARKEEERLEAERKAKEEEKAREMADGSKWPVYKYEVSPGKADQGIICLVWGDAPEFTKDMVECRALPQVATTFTLDNNQQLLSNIIRLTPTHPDYVPKEPIDVAIPFYTPRPHLGREAVMVAETSDGQWTAIYTKEVTFSCYKNMKFGQAKVMQLTNLAIVSVPKRDSLRLSNLGGKMASTMDNRITFTVEPNTFEQDESIIMQIRPVETSDVSNLKTAKTKNNDLLASSSIIDIDWTTDNFRKPVTMTLPCPPNTSKATSKGTEQQKNKVGSKIPAKAGTVQERERQKKNNEDDDNEVLFLMSKSSEKGWQVTPIEIEQPKYDMTQFQLDQPVNSLMVLRTKPTVTSSEAEKLAKDMEEQLNLKRVLAIVRQRNQDSCDLTLHVVQPADVEERTKTLSDDGYGDGPAVSSFFMVAEGDEIEVNFRGNVKSSDTIKSLQGYYNSPVCTSFNFSVGVENNYMQEKYPMYQGFVQLFKKEKVSVEKTVKDDDGKTRREPIFEAKRVFLCEVLIQLPKENVDLATQPPATARVKVVGRSDGLNEELLRHLAVELGDDWEGLVKNLGVSKMKVNTIRKKARSIDDVKFEVLLSWIKTQSRGESQVKKLQEALENSGHKDLASGLVTEIERFRDAKGQ